ncbi:N-acetyl-L,L-diaminopimelate deacetylase [Corynebacterium casei]|uniref:amidohydrolase n=1 Tax=Corynebacterium casei TaxID=160386 RepID=UPI0009D2F67A|nr:amidohydrolase [Corynebacterium casei]SLM88860.1 N-acetyl-L,L-diaminopimelate deacetylase [Corynebacterium casei]
MNQSNSISQLLASHSADLDWQREFYEDLHRHPELSHHEERTASKIEAKLAEFDCELVTGIGGFGIAAIFRSPDEGPTMLMRADFDALPVVEQTGVDFASMNGNMHACGHDMHATALLGACAIINSLRGKWSGTFIALFQPAEETSDGAKRMLADDLISLIPRPDVCLAQHIMPGPAGQVQTAAGPIMAGCDSIRIRIAGRSAHASMPDKSIDPTLIAAMIVVRLQAIVGREVPPGEFFVISVGELHSGDKNNIIPDSAELVLNTRYYDPALAERVYAALHRVVEAECAASASPAQPTFEYFAHGEVTDNDPATAIAVRATFDDVFSDNVIDAKPSTASEDFCYLPQAWGVPYYFWLVGSTPEELLDNPPVNHQSNFIPDFEPTCHSSTQAGAAAVLSFLAKG